MRDGWSVVVDDRAAAEIAAAIAWWREHRPSAEHALLDELANALQLISSHPGASPRATAPGLEGVRRILLRKTGFHLYYRIRDALADVEVIAFWHSHREPPSSPR